MSDSIWFRTLSAAQRGSLTASTDLPASAEVVIVGAGMIGLCTALSLVRRGVRDIVVVERGGVCGESTGSSAGGIWLGHECLRGSVSPSHAQRSRALFDQLDDDFDLDFARSGLLMPSEVTDRASLERTQAAGINVEWLAGSEIRDVEPRLAYEGGAYYLAEDGSIHPAKFGASLATYLREHGVKICLADEVQAVAPSQIRTSTGAVSSGTIVVTAGAWTPLVTRLLGWEPPIKPVRGTLVSYPAADPGTLRPVVISGNYYYWQLACGPIAGGGSEDDLGFERGVDATTVAAIDAEFRALYPSLGRLEAEGSWSGFRPYCEDMNPVIGAVPGTKNVYVAAGHFRKGIQLGPLTGELLAEEIVSGNREPESEKFRPDRFARNATTS